MLHALPTALTTKTTSAATSAEIADFIRNALHLADRWGRREHGTVVLSLRLTQGLLAELVSARRTSVNTALKQLVAHGTLERRGTARWALRGDPPDHLLSGR